MDLPGACLYLITSDDLSKHRLELARCMDWHKLKAYTQELLHSDDDGRVPPQINFDKVQERHVELFQLYMQKETEELSVEEAEKLWFYIEKENNGTATRRNGWV